MDELQRQFPGPGWGRYRRWLTVGLALLGLALLALVFPWPANHEGRTVRQWLETAAVGDYRERQAAEAAFRALGTRAVPDLIAALQARDTRWTDARAWLARRVLKRQETRLPADETRALAAAALGELGSSAAPAARALVKALGDDQPPVVANSAHALRRIGSGALPAILAGLSASSPPIRCESALLLGGPPFNTEARRWVEAMEKATRDPESRVRAAAVSALAQTRDPRWGRVIESALADPDFSVRYAAAWALGEYGSDTAEPAAALRRALGDPHPRVRIVAARALWRLTGDTNESLAVLEREVLAPNPDYTAALVLRELGPAAAATAPSLLRRLEQETVHRPSRTPSPAALALGQLGPTAVPGLIERLEHPRPEVRVGAAFALRNQGTNAAAAVPKLVELVDHPDAEVRITAVEALGAIGAAARPALPRLRQLAAETGDYLRAAAVNAVEQIEAASSPTAVPRGPDACDHSPAPP
ncbi:MAG: HEAT repeat domain-containing protein [Verrucomicrobia bacterium]|nr:HEAT repeat domain-containing protein [Verrucomicrobiota bacterium]